MTPAQLTILKTEITTDPLARGYAAMDDPAVAASLNKPDRQPNRETLTGGMLAASVVRSEFDALSAAVKTYVQTLIGAGEMPVTQQLRTELAAVFGAATTTRANLLALLKRTGTRAEELDLGSVTPSDVADSRRL